MGHHHPLAPSRPPSRDLPHGLAERPPTHWGIQRRRWLHAAGAIGEQVSLAGGWGGQGTLQQPPSPFLADPLRLGQCLDAGFMLAPPEVPIEQGVTDHRILFLYVIG